ncbi:MAG TPA: TIM barrel protein [Bryobacteraceae bacterium]|nr:TIM barrel protein [Bryobacteraceae bacterium]
MRISRRQWMALAAAAPLAAQGQGPKPLKISIFSKHLQFLDVAGMAVAAKEAGADGIDFAVRKGAHILPERVKEELPGAVDTLRKAGLEVPMLTTAIVDATTPHAETILRTAASLGIRHYRWGDMRYNAVQPIPEQLEAMKPRVKALADLNRELGMCGMYHTHSGQNEVGASIWDLWLLFKDHDPKYISANLDVAHATVEGGLGGWLHSTRLILPYTRGTAIKDFVWAKNAKGGWAPQWCPLGEGMVDWPRYCSMLKAARFDGPVQMHYEYPLGGADHGNRQITVDRATVITAMRKDIEKLRGWFKEASL